MPNENFLTYIESDPNSRLTVTADRVTFTALPRNEGAPIIYKDMGVAYFNADYEIRFTINISSQDTGNVLPVLVLTNYLGSMGGLIADLDDAIFVLVENPSGADPRRIDIAEVVNGSVTTSDHFAQTFGTTYYCKLVRDESVGTYGWMYLYFYSDGARTNLVATVSLALNSKEDFRYIWAVGNYNTGSTQAISGYIEKVLLLPAKYTTTHYQLGAYKRQP
ncbi:MAG: hypothetical protein Q8O55_00675 [Dehalococcoidales bacterium]|nr:hypothetical protein [Dehalococcoidales bacterium]